MKTTFSNNSIIRQEWYFKSQSNDALASQSSNGNSKQLSLFEKSGSNIKGTFPATKSIIDSDSKAESLNLMILLITRLILIVKSQNGMDWFPVILLESQRHYLLFMSAFQRIRINQVNCNQEHSSEKKSLTCLLLMKKQITAEFLSSLSSIRVYEIHSKWIGQYNCNFVTNYKKFEKCPDWTKSTKYVSNQSWQHFVEFSTIYQKVSKKKMFQMYNPVMSDEKVPKLKVLLSMFFTWYLNMDMSKIHQSS